MDDMLAALGSNVLCLQEDLEMLKAEKKRLTFVKPKLVNN